MNNNNQFLNYAIQNSLKDIFDCCVSMFVDIELLARPKAFKS